MLYRESEQRRQAAGRLSLMTVSQQRYQQALRDLSAPQDSVRQLILAVTLYLMVLSPSVTAAVGVVVLHHNARIAEVECETSYIGCKSNLIKNLDRVSLEKFGHEFFGLDWLAHESWEREQAIERMREGVD